ncbi:hypothetical protein QL093DRAFT_1457576 [Fusarium oxysporum]|nr:hypothetical protein QL093DRAFT_1457576 [Fusarium oxysporum]
MNLAALNTTAKEFYIKLGDLVFRNKCGMQIHRLLVVGEDINPFDVNDMTWAFATRCRPSMDEFHFEDVPAYPLVPYMSHGPWAKLTSERSWPTVYCQRSMKAIKVGWHVILRTDIPKRL